MVGSGLAGRRRRRLAGRARLQRQVLLLPGLAPARPLDRGAGRHQRRQELPQRRRQHLPALLRHREGRRLPRPRGQRLPARRRSRVNIIDQCVAQGVPFAREYGGLLDNRSFGGAQVSRTFYARGQTGQQLLLGAYQALERQIGLGQVEMYSRHEMLELVVVDGRARGIVVRDMVTGEIADPPRRRRAASPPAATATSSTSRPTPRAATPRRSGAPTRKAPRSPTPASRRSIRPASRSRASTSPSSTLMSESLRNDGRIWVPKQKGDKRPPGEIPEAERDYYLERMYPSFGNLAPRDISSRAAKTRLRRGPRRRPDGLRRLPRLRGRDRAAGQSRRSRRSTATSSRCTSASPTRTPTRSRCASTPPPTTRWAASGWTTT